MLDIPRPSQWGFAVSIQITIIAVCTSFLLKGIANSFILLALMFSLLLFALQAISSRFLMLWPINGFMQRPTPDIDTAILYVLIILSVLCLFLGASTNLVSSMDQIEKPVRDKVVLTGSLFLLLSPLCWWKWGKTWIRKRVTDKLKLDLHTFRDLCPRCKQHYARFQRCVVDWNEGFVIIQCDDACPREERFVVLNIAN